MKITLDRKKKDGYALVIVSAFLIIIGITFTSMWLWTSTNGSLTQRNNTFNQSAAAAEAATEYVFSTMDRDFLYGSLKTNTAYTGLYPDTSNTNLWPIQYTFSNTNGAANSISVSEDVTVGTNLVFLNSQYSGLKGYVQNCTIVATATPHNQRYNVPATVKQTFQAAIIPIFQFAIFYNLNLEMACGQPQIVQGLVFCNASIWEGSSLLTFTTNVIAVGTNNTSGVNPFNTTYTTGSSANQGSYAQYDGTPLANFSQGAPTDQANALTLPIGGGTSTNTNPTNVEAILNLPPSGLGAPNAAAYNTTNQIYLFNECDLVISNASYGTNGYATSAALGKTVDFRTNLTVWYQDSKNAASPLTLLTNDLLMLKTYSGTNANNYAATNILYKGYSFLTNISFIDYRESATVQAVEIDVTKLQRWFTNRADKTTAGVVADDQILHDFGHRIGSIYVYNSVPLTTTQLPAVRLVNGSCLITNYPGLTVATPQPVYIQGNYNVQTNATSGGNDIGTNYTAHTYPASILADAITILSTNWSDSYTNEDPSGTTHGAGDTTINAAMLEGIVPTNPNGTSAATGYYSGGVENFLRLLEDWGSTGPSGHNGILTYNGSIVVMFPSIYATNYWGNSGYYGVPTRHWAFDLNFQQASGLPPLSPSSRALIRGNWSAY